MATFYEDANLENALDHDAKILAKVVSKETIQNNDEEAWKHFLAAGGDDGHSGASWSAVKYLALQLLNGVQE